MKPARRSAAYVLIEVVVVVIVGSAVAGLMVVLLNNAFYVQRTAGAHADREAAIDGLTRQMRRDALAAWAYRWDGSTLVLETVAEDGRREVGYTITGNAVVRTEGPERHVWQAVRLRFAARLESGPDADVFLLDFIEQPAPRARTRAPRSITVPLLLPGRPPEDGS